MLGILGIVVVIVATVLAYRTAKQYERNAVAWAAIVLAVGFGIQILVPIMVAIVIAVFMFSGVSSEPEVQLAFQAPAMIIGIACLFLSIVGVLLILRFLSKVPEEKSFTQPPAPPETFN
jgi:cytochrome bd-type quinol oxidase subunit 2